MSSLAEDTMSVCRLSMAMLAQQMSALEAYWTTTVRFDRPSRCVTDRTWQSIQQQCALFLDYCQSHHHIAQPNLELFLNQILMTHFVNFQGAAGHSPRTIHNIIYVAKMVTRWWATTPAGQQNIANQVLAWLQALQQQVQNQQPIHPCFHD